MSTGANQNYRGVFATAADLPEAFGSPSVYAGLQEGHFAYVQGTGTLWTCTDPTPGNALWTDLGASTPGPTGATGSTGPTGATGATGGVGPTGPSQDIRAPKFVVGNVTAGDTADECDFLDIGDGARIQLAVAQAILVSGGVVGDVYVRPGVYDFDLNPSQKWLDIPANVRVTGAGVGRTVLVGSSVGGLVRLDANGATLENLSVQADNKTSPSGATLLGVVSVNSPSLSSSPFTIRNVKVSISSWSSAGNPVRSAVAFEGGAGLFSPQANTIDNVTAEYSNSLLTPYTPIGNANPRLNFCGFLDDSTFVSPNSTTTNFVIMRACQALNFETGFASKYLNFQKFDRCVSDNVVASVAYGISFARSTGHYASGANRRSTDNTSVAAFSQSTGVVLGFAVDLTEFTSSSAVYNSSMQFLGCTATNTSNAVGTGFLLSSGGTRSIRGIRVQSCRAITLDFGLIATSGVEYLSGQNFSASSCTTGLSSASGTNDVTGLVDSP